MATARNSNEVAISSDAMDALDCFSDGMDRVVFDMASNYAMRRGATADGVVVTADDIEKAVAHLIQVMDKTELEPNVRESVEAMFDCCRQRLTNQ